MSKKKEVKIEIKGEGHTLGAMVQRELLEDVNVELAGYDIPHPLLNTMVLYIRSVKGKKPKDILIKTLDRLEDKLVLLITEFDKAWNKKKE